MLIKTLNWLYRAMHLLRLNKLTYDHRKVPQSPITFTSHSIEVKQKWNEQILNLAMITKNSKVT